MGVAIITGTVKYHAGILDATEIKDVVKDIDTFYANLGIFIILSVVLLGLIIYH